MRKEWDQSARDRAQRDAKRARPSGDRVAKGVRSAEGMRKDARRENLLELCGAFLRSLVNQSDEVLRRYGHKRGEDAQIQYLCAKDLVESIRKELLAGKKWDENRNEIISKEENATL